MRAMKILEKAAARRGMTVQELLEDVALGEGENTGVCLRCGNVQECEPDAQQNYCYDCEENAVMSVLVLAGIC